MISKGGHEERRKTSCNAHKREGPEAANSEGGAIYFNEEAAMLREMKNDILWCYRDDRKKMANTVFAFCLTVLCMLALIVILAIR